MKFSVYLEYFILCQEQRPKVVPPFYQLLSQILPYLDKFEVEHYNLLTPTGSSFGGDIPVKVHPSVDDTPDIEEEEEEGDLLRFIQTTAKAYRHSTTNARTLGEYMYISAFDLRSDEQFASAHEKIKENVTSSITRMRDLVQYEKALTLRTESTRIKSKEDWQPAEKAIKSEEDWSPALKRDMARLKKRKTTMSACSYNTAVETLIEDFNIKDMNAFITEMEEP